jgi:cytochrome c oxidase subunit II
VAAGAGGLYRKDFGKNMMEWMRSLLMPVAASDHAHTVDFTFGFILAVSVFFFFLIAGLLFHFVTKYRRREYSEPTPYITHNSALEVVWTIIPLIVVIVIFFLGFHSYLDSQIAPGDALEIKVTAKKWLWQFEYPNGIRTLNELHVPANRPVKLIMSSEDVIHSFFLPTMRIKQDILPNRYTTMWFQSGSLGVHTVFCTEYCGRGHSDMLARVHIDDENQYQEWLETGGDAGKDMPLSEFGALLFESRGCVTCHSLDGTRREGPSLKGVFGHAVRFADGTSIPAADENYIRESILRPQAKIVAGYQGVMPTFEGLLRPRELDALVEFIKTQQ